MTLADIADGLEVTTEQRDSGVAAVDATETDLRDALAEYAPDLPCDAEAAAEIVEGHTSGRSIGDSARAAGVAPMTAAKTLHLLGCEGVSPLTPRAHDIVADWLSADLSRHEAVELAGASESEFALATFVETHDPLAGAGEVVGGYWLVHGGPRKDPLEEARSDVGELL